LIYGWVTVTSDEEDESFVQECSVCCRPWNVRIRHRGDGSAEVTVGPEGE
jgi:hypothetical protein